MTLFGLFSALLGLFALPFAIVHRTRLRLTVFILAYLVHIAAGIVFYYYSLSNISDSTNYYYDEFQFASAGFGFGTQLIYFMVRSGRDLFGGSFLDYFIFFQALGFFGIAALMRIIEEIHDDLDIQQPIYSYLILFLPGIQFWTSSIGKDGIIFSGICLTMWASMNIRRRYVWAALGLLITVVIRPHIAIIHAGAMALSLFLDRRSNFFVKAALTTAALGGMLFAVVSVQSTFSLDVTNADSVSDFLAGQEHFAATSSQAGTTVVQGNILVKAFSLLFRPLFIDAEGAFGLVASAENLLLMFIFATLLFRMRDTLALVRSLAFVRYTLAMAIGTAFLLSIIYYNVGLGLRQKWMFMPGFIILFILVMALRRARHAPHEPALQASPSMTVAAAAATRPRELPASPYAPR